MESEDRRVVTLQEVLAEYRAKYHPHSRIDPNDLSGTIGFLTALSLPSSPGMRLTAAQQEYVKAVRTMTRCRRLIADIERHERI